MKTPIFSGMWALGPVGLVSSIMIFDNPYGNKFKQTAQFCFLIGINPLISITGLVCETLYVSSYPLRVIKNGLKS